MHIYVKERSFGSLFCSGDEGVSNISGKLYIRTALPLWFNSFPLVDFALSCVLLPALGRHCFLGVWNALQIYGRRKMPKNRWHTALYDFRRSRVEGFFGVFPHCLELSMFDAKCSSWN